MLRSGQLSNGVVVNQANAPAFKKTKIVRIKYEHKNGEVLSALRKLAGEDFGYDERTWRLWWIARKNGAGKIPNLE